MFFRYFPTISYKVDNQNSLITDISVAFLQKRLFLNTAYNFRRYTILEGESPEAVSYKLYDTVRFHWVIMFMNNIVDPMTDWFMNSDLLYDFTLAKYPEIQNDPTNSSGVFGVNHYRWYYDELKTAKYLRLDDVDEKEWRYKGGRNYLTTDEIIISPPNELDGTQATAYINRIDELGAITDVVLVDRGSGYTTQPNFTITSENGYGFQGEIITNGSESLQELLILPIGEQIRPISNLQYETEINASRREILAITKDHIVFFEEQLYNMIGQY